MDAQTKTGGRVVAVKAAAAAVPLEDEARWEWLEDCQSFMASTAVHLVALILLGLLAAAAPKQ